MEDKIRKAEVTKSTKLLQILQNKKILARVGSKELFPDEPRIFLWRVVFHQTKLFSSGRNVTGISGTGCSLVSEKEAFVKSVSEAVERYSLCVFDNSRILFSKPPDSNFVAPVKFAKSAKTKQLGWVEGMNMITGKNWLMPAQAVFLNYQRKGERQFIGQNSSGAAAAFSREDALLGAIYEAVERDVFLTTYLNKHRGIRLNERSIEDQDVLNFITNAKTHGLECAFFYLSNDLKIPVILSVIIDRNGLGPAISIGLKSKLNWESAVKGSLVEAVQIRYWMKLNMWLQLKRGIYSFNSQKVKNVVDRANYWTPKTSISKLNFILNQRPQKAPKAQIFSSNKEELSQLILSFKKMQKDIFCVDLTQSEFKEVGHFVYKAIIPSLQAFYMAEEKKYINLKRVKEVATYLKSKGPTNIIPHPLL